jgi:hypothetical protein
MTVQEQPLWAFPMFGWFKWRNRTLRLTKAGYDVQTVELAEVAPSTPYGNKVVSVAVKMKRANNDNREGNLAMHGIIQVNLPNFAKRGIK